MVNNTNFSDRQHVEASLIEYRSLKLGKNQKIKDLRVERGRIDTALLCELAAHPDFVKLLADIQIYVEGIAAT